MPTIFPSRSKTHFQLIHAAMTPKGSDLTSISLYITRKFEGLLSGLNNFSPCFMVHFSFSTLTKNFSKRCIGLGLPRPRHAVAAMIPWLSKRYLKQREIGRAHEITSPAVRESLVPYSPANLAAAPVALTLRHPMQTFAPQP